MEPYLKQLDEFGLAILDYTDPDNKLRGPTQGWFMVDFRSAALVAIAYVTFVFVGSMLFKIKAVPAINPYPLKFFYNLSQVLLCGYMAVEAGLIAYRNNYTLLPCEPFNAESPPVVNVLYIFYISKMWDFWDTIFIIIGKKWNQLSFLHVYHHTTIFLFYWLNANVYYDGDIYLTIVLNGFIHFVMYTYYFVSMHTKIPKKIKGVETGDFKGQSVPIWWKPVLTMSQMVQFVGMISQACYLLLTDCPTCNRRVTIPYLFYIGTLLFLFAQFFVASYCKPKKSKKKAM